MNVLSTTSLIPLQHDVHCIHCLYNLRTLRPDARCPECGNAVGDTLVHHRAHGDAVAFPGVFRAAALCFAVLGFLALPVHFGFVLLRGHREIPIEWMLLVEIVTHLAFVLLFSLGIFLFNASLGRSVLHGAIRTLLSLVALAYAGMGMLTSLSMTALLMSRRGRGPFRLRIAEMLLREQRIVTVLVIFVSALIAYYILRRVAKSIAVVQFDRMSRAAFAALAACTAFSFVVYLAIGTWRRAPDPSRFNAAFTAIDACTAVMGVFLGCYWIYAGRLVRQHAARTEVRAEPLVVPAHIPEAGDKVEKFLAQRAAGAGRS